MSASLQQIVIRALLLYAVFSLTAMAGMNLSFLLLALLLLRVRLPNALSRLPEFKCYLRYGGFLFFACLLSLVVAKFFPVIYAGHAPEITVHGFLKIWYLFCPLIFASVFLSLPDPEKTIRLFKNAWWMMTLALAALALIQFFYGWPMPVAITDFPGHYHANLFFGHHLSTASILIFPTFVAIAMASGQYLRNQTFYWFAIVTGAAGVLILFLSYSRAAWLSVPIGLLILCMRYLKPRARVSSIASIVVAIAIISQTRAVKERIDHATGILDRYRLWTANIDFFKHNPLTGIGWLKTQEMSEFYFKQLDPEHYTQYFWGHAHSNFFEMLGGTGLIGLFAFLAWSFFTLRLAVIAASTKNTNSNPVLQDFACGLGVALVLLHINGLTNVTFWEGKVMHQQMLAVGLLLVIRSLQTRGLQTRSAHTNEIKELSSF